MIVLTTEYLLDHFTLQQLQEAIKDIDKDANNHDLTWYTVSDRATKMREIRANLVQALHVKKDVNIAADKLATQTEGQ